MKKLLVAAFAAVAGACAVADDLYRVTLAGGAGSTYASFAEAIAAADVADDSVVELLADDLGVWNAAVTVSHTMTLKSGAGGPFMLRRGGTNAEIFLGQPSAVKTFTIQDIVLDGGAIWTTQDFVRPTSTADITAADTANLANTGVGQSKSLISFRDGGKMKLVLGSGCTIQNVHAGVDHATIGQYTSYGTISAIAQYTTYITMEEGSTIRDCRGEGATLNIFGSGELVMNGGTIDHCYAPSGYKFTYSGVIRVHGGGSTQFNAGRIINCMSSRPFNNENGGVIDMARPARFGAAGKELYVTNNWGYSLGAVASPNAHMYLVKIGGGKVVIKDNFKVGDAPCDVGILTGKAKPSESKYPLALEGSLAAGSDIGVTWEDGDAIGVRVGSNTSPLNEGARYIHNQSNTLRAMVSPNDSTQLLWRDGTQNEFVYTYSNSVERVFDGQPHGISDTIEVTDPAGGYTIRYATDKAGPYSTTEPTYTAVGRYPVHFELSAPTYVTLTNTTVLFIGEAPQAGAARVSTDGGENWTAYDSAVGAIAAANASAQAETPIVELLSDATFESRVEINRAMTIRSGEGGPYVFTRNADDAFINIATNPLQKSVFTVAITNVVLDGGARWTNPLERPVPEAVYWQNEAVARRTQVDARNMANWGIGACESFIRLHSTGWDNTMTLQMDCVTVRNVHAGGNAQWGFTGTIGLGSASGNQETKILRHCTFVDCRGQGATYNAGNGSGPTTLEDCEFRSCYAAMGGYNWSGVIRIHTDKVQKSLTRVKVHGCVAAHPGGEGGGTVDLARATTLTDCIITNNYGIVRGGVFTPTANANAVTFCGNNVIRDNVTGTDAVGGVYTERNVFVNFEGGLKAAGPTPVVRGTVGVTTATATGEGDVFGTADASTPSAAARVFFNDTNPKLRGKIDRTTNKLVWSVPKGLTIVVR